MIHTGRQTHDDFATSKQRPLHHEHIQHARRRRSRAEKQVPLRVSRLFLCMHSIDSAHRREPFRCALVDDPGELGEIAKDEAYEDDGCECGGCGIVRLCVSVT